MVRLWAACRGSEGGIAHWPDAGGVADQAAWVIEAFSTLSSLDAAWSAEERKRGGR